MGGSELTVGGSFSASTVGSWLAANAVLGYDAFDHLYLEKNVTSDLERILGGGRGRRGVKGGGSGRGEEEEALAAPYSPPVVAPIKEEEEKEEEKKDDQNDDQKEATAAETSKEE